MKHTITVTQEDINIGSRGNCQTCPLAHAFNRAIPIEGGWYVTFSQALPDVSKCVTFQPVTLPFEANKFILDFDHNREGAVPFSFEVEYNV